MGVVSKTHMLLTPKGLVEKGIVNPIITKRVSGAVGGHGCGVEGFPKEAPSDLGLRDERKPEMPLLEGTRGPPAQEGYLMTRTGQGLAQRHSAQ